MRGRGACSDELQLPVRYISRIEKFMSQRYRFFEHMPQYHPYWLEWCGFQGSGELDSMRAYFSCAAFCSFPLASFVKLAACTATLNMTVVRHHAF